MNLDVPQSSISMDVPQLPINVDVPLSLSLPPILPVKMEESTAGEPTNIWNFSETNVTNSNEQPHQSLALPPPRRSSGTQLWHVDPGERVEPQRVQAPAPWNLGEDHLCKFCLKKFGSADAVKLHITAAHPAHPTCFLCNANFNNWADFRHHMSDKHSKRRVHRPTAPSSSQVRVLEPKRPAPMTLWSCPICPRTFDKAKLMSEHEDDHLNDRLKFKCDECDALFTTPYHLRSHERRIHKRGVVQGAIVWKKLSTECRMLEAGAQGGVRCFVDDQGYCYVRSSPPFRAGHPDTSVWRCEFKNTCPGRLWLRGDNISIRRAHSHTPSLERARLREVHSVLRKLMEEDDVFDKPSTIVEKVKRAMPGVIMPPQKALRKIIERERKRREHNDSVARKEQQTAGDAADPLNFLLLDKPAETSRADNVRTQTPEKAINLELSDVQTPVACQLCGEVFANGASLISHVRTHSFGQSPKLNAFRCLMCPYTAAHAGQLEQHINKHAHDTRPYEQIVLRPQDEDATAETTSSRHSVGDEAESQQQPNNTNHETPATETSSVSEANLLEKIAKLERIVVQQQRQIQTQSEQILDLYKERDEFKLLLENSSSRLHENGESI